MKRFFSLLIREFKKGVKNIFQKLEKLLNEIFGFGDEVVDSASTSAERRVKEQQKAQTERVEGKRNRPERKRQEKANRKKAGKDIGNGLVEGHYSKRPFNPDKAGGFILDLSWENAEITKDGIDVVKKHLGRFEDVVANRKMIKRLEDIETGKLEITDWDKRFYTHEKREYERYRDLGYENIKHINIPEEIYNNAHSATLEDYKLFEFDKDNKRNLYHPGIEDIDFFSDEDRKILGY